MKTSTKVTIGLSVAAAASVATAVVVSGKVIEKIHHLSNRTKVKKFVYDKFDGNEKLLDVVDHLSDSDLDSLMGMLAKIKSGKKKISVYGDSIKDSTEDAKGRLMSLVEKMI
ncbi:MULTISPECIES: hypothetical protein [Enterococcus]|uniref:Uncharacterized protein n=1 Tax=Enterococcus mundtii TaxID=53346 RepID=A0A1A6G896_ENTMU|nr:MULTISPECIES: hypothetical protein [Enterococcus]MBE6172729.1 hypothetical protein [Enterococcus faecium]GEN17646.1 hypothetical protein LAC02_09270 [Ligilactobacillus acidipiscis]AUB51900.1 hypothetical protein EM4838_02410 [Enterococcus mundtii]MBO1086732.1 hypothetical protein [Enterococcus mundtii]MDB7088506.1 hypothetical protein [Enterococcus mundtii]